MIGIEETDTEESIAAELAIVHAGAPVPFGIGLVSWVVDQRPELLDVAIEARPTLIGISFGDAGPHVGRLHDAGILVASQVQSRQWAEVAIEAGVDVLVAQGTEGGGHTGAVATLPLLQIVLELTDLPGVAAGGIASGRGLAAGLAAGAVGAWVGTPLLLAEEARNSAAARERIALSDETETLYTSVYDRLQDKGWPAEFRARAIRTAFGVRWTGRRGRARRRHEAPGGVRPGTRGPNYDIAHIYAGSRSACSTPSGPPQRSSRTSRLRRASCSTAGSRATRSAPEGGVDRGPVPVALTTERRGERGRIQPESGRARDDPVDPRGLAAANLVALDLPATGTNVILAPERATVATAEAIVPLRRVPSRRSMSCSPRNGLSAGQACCAFAAGRVGDSRGRGCGRAAPSPRSRGRRSRGAASSGR